jgi:hypothetical protein
MERKCQHQLHHLKRSPWQTSALYFSLFLFSDQTFFSILKPGFASLTPLVEKNQKL